MPLTSLVSDAATLTTTIVAEFPVPLHRLWDAYADPRRLERFWGPPTWPARFTRHDFHPGGRSEYTMTGPDGERSRGYWEFLTVEAPHSFSVIDGFAHEDGSPNRDLPGMRMVFSFEATEGGSRLTTTTHFNSIEELEQLTEMGMEEGTRQAMSQIDAVVAELAEYAAGIATAAEILSDTQVRVARVLRAPVDLVWRAHHDRAMLQRWLLGPDGWTMPVCEVAERVGDGYRYEWAQVDGTGRFGFEGELLESEEPVRAVTTERMIGVEGPGTVNELTLTPLDDGTLLSIVITYPDAGFRDMVLATGMTDGMETSYARLEAIAAA
ncbi:MAG: SRPBCC domain-containing protein [Microbacteriaceae bacterium]|nr:SRPBCC domain-containing protein [Microbacteriaceae bacterium]